MIGWGGENRVSGRSRVSSYRAAASFAQATFEANDADLTAHSGMRLSGAGSRRRMAADPQPHREPIDQRGQIAVIGGAHEVGGFCLRLLHVLRRQPQKIETEVRLQPVVQRRQPFGKQGGDAGGVSKRAAAWDHQPLARPIDPEKIEPEGAAADGPLRQAFRQSLGKPTAEPQQLIFENDRFG